MLLASNILMFNSALLQADASVWGSGLGIGITGFILLCSAGLLALRKYANKQKEYAQMFADSPVANLIVACDTGAVLEANNEGIEMFGLSTEELYAKRITDLLPGAHFTDSKTLINQHATDAEVSNLWALTTPNGKQLYVLAKLHSIQFKNKPAFRILLDDGTAVELQKQKNEKLRLDLDVKNKYLNSIVNSQDSISIIRTDMAGNYTFINNSFLDKFGITAKEFIGKGVDGTIITDDMPACDKAVLDCLQTLGKSVKVVLRKPNIKTGQVRTTQWEFVAILDENGQPTEIQCMGQEITELLVLTEELQKQKDQMAAILSSVNEVICSFSPDFTNVEYINPACVQLLGYTPAEFYANPKLFFEIIHQDDLELANKNFKYLLSVGQIRTELQLIHKNGSGRYFSVYSKLKKDSNAQLESVTAVLTDITEQRANEIVILEQNQNLRQIAWVQSHKVRAPLARLLGLVQILKVTEPTDPENKNYLAAIKEQAQELDAVIGEVVGLTAKIEIPAYVNSDTN